VTSGNNGGTYTDGDIIEHTCHPNFASIDILMCTCNTTSTPMWDCGDVNFATTCKTSEFYNKITRYSVVKHVTKTHNVFNLFLEIVYLVALTLINRYKKSIQKI